MISLSRKVVHSFFGLFLNTFLCFHQSFSAVLVVSAICLVRWPGSWDKPGKYWKHDIKKENSIQFNVICGVAPHLWRWCWCQHCHENETRRNCFPRLSLVTEENINVGHRFHQHFLQGRNLHDKGRDQFHATSLAFFVAVRGCQRSQFWRNLDEETCTVDHAHFLQHGDVLFQVIHFVVDRGLIDLSVSTMQQANVPV